MDDFVPVSPRHGAVDGGLGDPVSSVVHQRFPRHFTARGDALDLLAER